MSVRQSYRALYIIKSDKMFHRKIVDTQDVAGFALKSTRKGEKSEIWIEGSMNSDHPLFYDYIANIHNIYLRSLVPMENCNKFLILRRADKSADIYINDFQYIATIIAKKNLSAGEQVVSRKIADITELTFPQIKINKTDAIIFCMRVGWRFVLYFNFSANPKTEKSTDLRLDEVYRALGHLYRNLLFEREYKILANDVLYTKLLADGWFPFIELLGRDYGVLSSLYENGWYDQVDEFLDRFDKERLDEISQSWWKKSQFNDKKIILEAGITAYLQGDEAGYINCIHTLYPQIEGIMGTEYFKEHGSKPSFPVLMDYIQSKATMKFSSTGSLGLPAYFYDYLSISVFQTFRLSTGEIDLSRHTTSHGYAKQEDFTRMRALQSIFILNQIYFYI